MLDPDSSQRGDPERKRQTRSQGPSCASVRAGPARRIRPEHQELLAGVLGELLHCTDPRQVIADLCQRVMEALDCHVYFNYLSDAQQPKRLHLNAYSGLPADAMEEIEWLDEGLAVCGTIPRDEHRLVVANIARDRDPRNERLWSLGIQTCACHLLKSQGKPVGTLSFASRTRERFSEDEMALVEAVADHVAIALDRAQTQQNLLAAHQRVEAILRSITDCYYAVDREWRGIQVNDQAAAYVGQPREALLGRVVWEALPKLQGTIYEREFRRAMAEQTPVHFEAPSALRNADHHAEVHAYPSPEGLEVYFRDITARKQAEEVLRQSEQHFRRLAEVVPQIVWIACPEGYDIYFNPRWYEYSGLPFEQSKGHRWRAAVHPDDVQRTTERWDDSVRTGEPFEVEYRLRRAADGMYRWHLSRGLPLRDDQGRIIQWFGMVTDIHALKEVEAKLHEANQAKDHFLAVLSHELRTPLTPVLTTVQMLERAPALPSPVRESLNLIRRNVELEARLVDDLLDLTRISRGKLRLDFQTVDLHEKVRQVVEVCDSDVRGKQLNLWLGLNAERHHVRGDPARIQQVLWNLLKNAIKFTPSGGSVWISTEETGDAIALTVRDTGVGIEADLLGRIFEAFEQGGRDTSRLFGGLGLGLSISKGLVDLHGGTIAAQSEGKGKGATFTVQLPRVAPMEAAADAGRERAASAGLPACRILLVEDHPDTARTMRLLLQSFGCEVRVADSVATALRTAAAEPFDLLVSDLGLPDGSGHDLMRQLSAQRPIRGIALSGFGAEEDLRKSREAGFAAHLIKPINIDILEETIRKVMGQ